MKSVQHNNENIDASPIPLEQQPVREYWCLKKRRFFRWAILDLSKYVNKLLAVWISSLLLALFVFAMRSPHRVLSYSELLIGAIIAELAVLAALIKLYAGWNYIRFRLIHREIDYKIWSFEQTKVYRKPKLMLARDVLIARFQVIPVLKRIEKSMMCLTIIISSSFLILFVTTN